MTKVKRAIPKILVQRRQCRLVLRQRRVIGRTQRQLQSTTCILLRYMRRNLESSWFLRRNTNSNHECCLRSESHLGRSCKKHFKLSQHKRTMLPTIYNHYIRRQLYRNIKRINSNIIKSTNTRIKAEISRLFSLLSIHTQTLITHFPSQVHLLGIMDGLLNQQHIFHMRLSIPTSDDRLH